MNGGGIYPQALAVAIAIAIEAVRCGKNQLSLV